MFSWILWRARDYFTCDTETDAIAASRPSKFLNQLYTEIVEPSVLNAAHVRRRLRTLNIVTLTVHRSLPQRKPATHKSIPLEAPDEQDRKWVESHPQMSLSDGTLLLDAPDELDRGLLKALVQIDQRNSNWQLHVKMEQWQRGRQELRQQKRHEQWTTVVLERKAALRSLANGVRCDIAKYVAIMRVHVGDAAYVCALSFDSGLR